MAAYGVHSETGKLRKVLVSRPDLAMKRLTPDNCRALLFDDVLWAKKARAEHDAFADVMRERGIEVLDFADLLDDVLALREARHWVLGRRLNWLDLEPLLREELLAWFAEMPVTEQARRLIGGVITAELPVKSRSLMGQAKSVHDVLPPPLPDRPRRAHRQYGRCQRLVRGNGWNLHFAKLMRPCLH